MKKAQSAVGLQSRVMPHRFNGGFVGEDGQPVEKTKYTHPYNYDPFVLWQGEGTATSSVYTDRLFQWDAQRHDELCQRYFGNRGQRWDSRKPAKIQDFLREWMETPELKLVRIIEYCNVATGFPVWRLDYAA